MPINTKRSIAEIVAATGNVITHAATTVLIIPFLM